MSDTSPASLGYSHTREFECRFGDEQDIIEAIPGRVSLAVCFSSFRGFAKPVSLAKSRQASQKSLAEVCATRRPPATFTTDKFHLWAI